MKIKKFLISLFILVIILIISFETKVKATDEVKTGLPQLKITLNGITLSEINSGSKDVKYKNNTLEITNSDDDKTNGVYDNIEIKGRGNYSWTLSKKSYQIKLSSKANIMGMGKSKTWLLIANHADATLMRNKLAYDLANEIGLDYTQESRWIDLWVDGEYQGNYLLTEKVQVEEKRVNLENDYGVIAEMDNNYYASETTWFESKKSKSHFVLKDSVADDEDSSDSKSVQAFNQFENYINTFENYLYSDNKNWEKISSMIDVESFIKYYFIQELTENPDGTRTSMFMYKDGKNDVLHMGPVWDLDLSFANCNKDEWGGNYSIDYISNINKYMVQSVDWYNQLFKIPEFRKEISRIYNAEIKNIFNTSIKKINNYKSIINESALLNHEKWNILGKNNLFGNYRGHQYKKTYEDEVEYLSNWIEKRIEYLNNRYNETSEIINVDYKAHIQDYGWTDYDKQNGEVEGITGKSKRLEAITINLDTFNEALQQNLSIKYKVHVQDYGWMEWKQNGEIAGTTGQGKRVEAIQIMLNDNSDYSIMYRVHVQDYGWMEWKKDGELVGTTGESKRIEAIQIKLVRKTKGKVLYNSHIQEYGWEKNNSIEDGGISGTVGKSKRIEAIKIFIGNDITELKNAHIKYQVHIQDIGWQDWKKDGEIAGTEGQSKRLEAIKIKLDNASEYSVKYRVHIQDIGWQDWKYDGEIAGTTGQSKRLEAIQIEIVK